MVLRQLSNQPVCAAEAGWRCSGNSQTSLRIAGATLSVGACWFLCWPAGGVWADQAVNFLSYKRRLATLLVLLLVSAVFILISLLPMLNVWYNAGALVAGLLLSAVLLLLLERSAGALPERSTGSLPAGRSGAGLLVQCSCALLLVSWVVLASVGLARNVGVGGLSDFFTESSCVHLKWWQCVEADLTPNGCAFDVYGNGTTTLLCPSTVRPRC